MAVPQALHHDIAVYDRNQRLIAVGEVKNKKHTSPQWAAQLRRNMLAHGRDPVFSEYFFIATPDRVYLWKGADLTELPRDIDARSLFTPYFQRAGLRLEDARPQAFELVVASWLSDLLRFDDSREELAAAQPGLIDSGFFDAILGGRLEYESAA